MVGESVALARSVAAAADHGQGDRDPTKDSVLIIFDEPAFPTKSTKCANEEEALKFLLWRKRKGVQHGSLRRCGRRTSAHLRRKPVAKWPSPTPRAAPVAVTTDNAGPVAVEAVLQNLAATMAAATAAAVTAQRFAGLVVRRRKKSRKRREWRQRKARIRKERAAVAAAVAAAQEQSGTAVLRVDAAVAAPAAVGAPGLVRSHEEARFACCGSPRRLGYHHPG